METVSEGSQRTVPVDPCSKQFKEKTLSTESKTLPIGGEKPGWDCRGVIQRGVGTTEKSKSLILKGECLRSGGHRAEFDEKGKKSLPASASRLEPDKGKTQTAAA